MQLVLGELLGHLGVMEELIGYETDSWQFHSDEKHKTCSAEVRMAGDQTEFEVEILTFLDEPDEEGPPVVQVLAMMGKPRANGKWSLSNLIVKGEPLAFSDWEAGACAFYTDVSAHIKREEFPDIDALIDEHLQGEGGQAGSRKKGGGRKNPKFKPPSNTISMKQGL